MQSNSTLIDLRQFIIEHFSREELELLCSDHFHEFYVDHRGMTLTNTSLAQKLVEYCERRNHLADLRLALHHLRPEPFGNRFGHVIDTQNHNHQKNRQNQKSRKFILSNFLMFIGVILLTLSAIPLLNLISFRLPARLSSEIASVSLPTNTSCQFQQPVIPQRLVIPSILVDATIVAVGPGRLVTSTMTQAKGSHIEAPRSKAVGWHDYSGRLGENKNIVLNGHNNIYGSVFLKLYTLRQGDDVYLQANDVACRYQVQEVLILLERDQPFEIQQKNSQYIQPMSNNRVTLTSSWPENSNTHVVIVVAKPIGTNPVVNLTPTDLSSNSTN